MSCSSFLKAESLEYLTEETGGFSKLTTRTALQCGHYTQTLPNNHNYFQWRTGDGGRVPARTGSIRVRADETTPHASARPGGVDRKACRLRPPRTRGLNRPPRGLDLAFRRFSLLFLFFLSFLCQFFLTLFILIIGFGQFVILFSRGNGVRSCLLGIAYNPTDPRVMQSGALGHGRRIPYFGAAARRRTRIGPRGHAFNNAPRSAGCAVPPR
jgi:hypothetical protein